ncbi:hypothetical protein [Agromyces sp. S2-1-8]|uniref:hypothetical protein n=1 Tax=Agromyces sp. S2-1-8 TaxID=2897180 RepID=UPI001E5DEFC2|nr:hypothetical protein [Agromyces sp. S2-1-8]MCD5346130.1 hypothetical protein [Agromyces sp. S2-1-8]
MFGTRRTTDRALRAIASDLRDLRTSLDRRDAAELHGVRESIDALTSDRASEAALAHKRHLAIAWVGGILACVFTITSIVLVMVSLPASPTSATSGRIGVVMPEAPDGAVQVYASFSGAVDSGAQFELVVSVLPTADSADHTSVGIFFCGPIRDGLELTQANTNDIPTPVPVEPGTTESDSRLGYRSECDFVTVSSDNWQVILYGKSNHALATTAGKKVLYSLPGVTTTFRDESVNGALMHPLPQYSTVDVAMAQVPSDLTISTAAPQIPAAGDLAWTSTDVLRVNAPSEYRLSGVLGDRESNSQALLFTAGALVGLAGAALLWAFEGIVDIALSRRLRRTAT